MAEIIAALIAMGCMGVIALVIAVLWVRGIDKYCDGNWDDIDFP